MMRPGREPYTPPLDRTLGVLSESYTFKWVSTTHVVHVAVQLHECCKELPSAKSSRLGGLTRFHGCPSWGGLTRA
jgi:hypothetical protein